MTTYIEKMDMIEDLTDTLKVKMNFLNRMFNRLLSDHECTHDQQLDRIGDFINMADTIKFVAFELLKAEADNLG